MRIKAAGDARTHSGNVGRLERDLRQEPNRFNGALEMLGLLRERLHLQRDELGGESGREAWTRCSPTYKSGLNVKCNQKEIRHD